MAKTIQIHDTAFITSAFRASNETISLDPYAKLWTNKGAQDWSKNYLNKVSKHEANAHCLRNRYFFNTINTLLKANKIKVLINFGSGFSMYPYCLDSSLINIEIDKPEIIEFKQKQTKQFIASGKLPERNIQYIGVDFNDDYQEELQKKINTIVKNQSSFILLEGVLFFLKMKEAKTLFNFFNSIQKQGDYIASASFRENIQETSAFKKLLQFTASETNIIDYLTVNDDFYTEIKNYKLIDDQDYFTLSKKHLNLTKIDNNNVLNERFYVLKNITDK